MHYFLKKLKKKTKKIRADAAGPSPIKQRPARGPLFFKKV